MACHPTFALRATVDNLRLSVASARWLANRSSLTIAGERRLVDLTGASWNRIRTVLLHLQALQRSA
jgi:hypothetical protein